MGVGNFWGAAATTLAWSFWRAGADAVDTTSIAWCFGRTGTGSVVAIFGASCFWRAGAGAVATTSVKTGMGLRVIRAWGFAATAFNAVARFLAGAATGTGAAGRTVGNRAFFISATRADCAASADSAMLHFMNRGCNVIGFARVRRIARKFGL